MSDLTDILAAANVILAVIGVLAVAGAIIAALVSDFPGAAESWAIHPGRRDAPNAAMDGCGRGSSEDPRRTAPLDRE